MSQQQPPSFTPDPKRSQRRKLRPQFPQSSEPASDPTPSRPSTTDGAPSFTPQRRSITSNQQQRLSAQPSEPSRPQQSQPPAFLPQSRRQASPPQPSAQPRTYRTNQHRSHPTAGRSTTENATHWPVPQQQQSAQLRSHSPQQHKKRRIGRKIFIAVLVILIAWPAFLIWDANRNLNRTTALSDATNTPGTTWLLAGSDSRAGLSENSDSTAARTDSIILIHKADNGQTSMISIPRDTYVNIPGYGSSKINASFSFGGPELLVETVEELTNLTIDHYVEIGMGGVAQIVDGLGGVELCLDMDVSDENSGLEWTAGCHVSDGNTALAFSRMRYSDPRGDLGRAERQRQVISQVVNTALSPSTFLNPFATLRTERAATSALTVDRESSIFNVAELGLAFRSATSSGLIGAPPIADPAVSTDAGLAVALVDDTAPDFFAKVAAGELSVADFVTEY